MYFPIDHMDDWCTFWTFQPRLDTAVPLAMHNTVSQLNELVQKPGAWLAGQRGHCYIAIYCSQRSKMDHSKNGDAEVKLTEDAKAKVSAVSYCETFLIFPPPFLFPIFLSSSSFGEFLKVD